MATGIDDEDVRQVASFVPRNLRDQRSVQVWLNSRFEGTATWSDRAVEVFGEAIANIGGGRMSEPDTWEGLGEIRFDPGIDGWRDSDTGQFASDPFRRQDEL